jgi:hypothetical protein
MLFVKVEKDLPLLVSGSKIVTIKSLLFGKIYRLEIFPGGFSLNLTRVNLLARNACVIIVGVILLFDLET